MTEKEQLEARINMLKVAAVGVGAVILMMLVGTVVVAYSIGRNWITAVATALIPLVIAAGFTYAIAKYSGYFEASKKYRESLLEERKTASK